MSAGFKACKKILDKEMKVRDYAFTVLEEIKQKKLEKILRGILDVQVFTQYPLPPESAWARKIYDRQVFGCHQPWFTVGFTAHCHMELRLVTEGRMLYCGVATSHVGGDDIKEKRRTFLAMNSADLAERIRNHGWTHEILPGQALLVPTRFIVASISTAHSTYGMRWATSADDSDKVRVVAGLKSLTKDYAELRTPAVGYVQLMEYLQ